MHMDRHRIDEQTDKKMKDRERTRLTVQGMDTEIGGRTKEF